MLKAGIGGVYLANDFYRHTFLWKRQQRQRK